MIDESSGGVIVPIPPITVGITRLCQDEYHTAISIDIPVQA
jgi:hypothetical protein